MSSPCVYYAESKAYLRNFSYPYFWFLGSERFREGSTALRGPPLMRWCSALNRKPNLTYVGYWLSYLYLQEIVLHGFSGLRIKQERFRFDMSVSVIYIVPKFMVGVAFVSIRADNVQRELSDCKLNIDVMYHWPYKGCLRVAFLLEYAVFLHCPCMHNVFA